MENKTEQPISTSNIDDINIESFIEKQIENKINQLMDILPQNVNVNTPKMVYEYTISELYNGTLQTIIDIINEVTELGSERKYISSKVYRERMFDSFFKKERKVFVGISMIILSFIIYFIDGSSA